MLFKVDFTKRKTPFGGKLPYKRRFANLARTAAVTATEADVYTLLKFRTIVCDKAGFEALVKRMGAVKKEAK